MIKMVVLVFVDPLTGLIYDTPDAYIIHKGQVRWGETLRVYTVYKKGSRPNGEYYEISARFYHEGMVGGVDDTYWEGLVLNNVEKYNGYKIVCFDLGPDCPRYFYSKEDLAWYITNIYDLYQPYINDEYPSED